MQRGKLKEKVIFERCIVSIDEYSHEEYTYVYAFSTRAQVKFNNGNRLIDNQEIFYENTVTFIVSDYIPYEETMRIKYRDKYYRILSVNNEKVPTRKIEIIAELINE